MKKKIRSGIGIDHQFDKETQELLKKPSCFEVPISFSSGMRWPTAKTGKSWTLYIYDVQGSDNNEKLRTPRAAFVYKNYNSSAGALGVLYLFMPGAN